MSMGGPILLYGMKTPLNLYQRKRLREHHAAGRFDLLPRERKVVCLLFIGSKSRYPLSKAEIGRITGFGAPSIGHMIEGALDNLAGIPYRAEQARWGKRHAH